MPQAYDPTLADARNFGEQVSRTISELKRPDLAGDVPNYLRDAIRFFSRQPFFFTEIDNTGITTWQASLYVPRGYTIRDTADDGNFYILVALTSGLNGTGAKPNFDHRLFAPNTSLAGNIFTAGQQGTTVDGAITWATVQAWPTLTSAAASFYWTQLSTVPTFNQLIPPVDYVAPYRVEITIPNLRYPLDKASYPKLRDQDVIRPAPITVYPSEYAWYQQLLHLWPYPIGFYPITLSYYTAPFPPILTTTSNFWTTTAEKMIRSYAKGLLSSEIIRNDGAAQVHFKAAKDEYNTFHIQEAEQNSGQIPPDIW